MNIRVTQNQKFARNISSGVNVKFGRRWRIVGSIVNGRYVYFLPLIFPRRLSRFPTARRNFETVKLFRARTHGANIPPQPFGIYAIVAHVSRFLCWRVGPEWDPLRTQESSRSFFPNISQRRNIPITPCNWMKKALFRAPFLFAPFRLLAPLVTTSLSRRFDTSPPGPPRRYCAGDFFLRALIFSRA